MCSVDGKFVHGVVTKKVLNNMAQIDKSGFDGQWSKVAQMTMR